MDESPTIATSISKYLRGGEIQRARQNGKIRRAAPKVEAARLSGRAFKTGSMQPESSGRLLNIASSTPMIGVEELGVPEAMICSHLVNLLMPLP
jgi:hypothetical protein